MKQERSVYSEPTWRIIALQHIAYIVTRTYFLLSGSRIHIANNWSINTSKRYVIASNHLSFFDPFVVTSALGHKRLFALLPCRFMATPTFLAKPLLGRGMRLIGAYPSHPLRDQPYGLSASYWLIERGQTIIIFPHGKRTRDRNARVHRGVSELAHTPRTHIIPVLIDKSPRALWPRYTIRVGAPFHAAGLTPEAIMRRLYQLEANLR